DLVELAGNETMVSREQVGFRLQLDGIAPAVFKVEGPSQARVVRGTANLSDRSIFDAARQALLKRLSAPAEDVEVKLVQPIQFPELALGARDEVRLDAELPA